MKRGKEEEKAVGPMFPRLHVNDTAEKGGPRAPPRNKMALYEQLSIPSQRFGSALNPTLPSPASSSQVRFVFTRFLSLSFCAFNGVFIRVLMNESVDREIGHVLMGWFEV